MVNGLHLIRLRSQCLQHRCGLLRVVTDFHQSSDNVVPIRLHSSTHQSITHSLTQSINHSITRSINQSINHTHTFNGHLSRTTRVGRYQKGKTNLDFTEARDSEWQWHQLGHMQVCTSLQTDDHASTPPLSFYRPDALPAAQPTASKH